MRIIKFTVNDEYNDRPLIHFLKGHVRLSAHIVQSLRHTHGAVIVNNTPARLIDKVFDGDEVKLHLIEKSALPPLWDFPLDIIFEDEDLLVVNKPYGVSTHTTYNHPNGTLCNAVANYFVKTKQPDCSPHAVGRLDKVTSGVMLFAKNSYVASRLNGNIEKIYTAIATGKTEQKGTINAPIYRPDPGKTVRTVDERGDNSVTHYTMINGTDDISFLEITTETGRTHQIRVHCAYMGNPLLGDEMYGGKVTENLKRAALHCKTVSIIHPISGERLCFTAPLPDDMKKELKKSGFFVDKQNDIC